MPIVDPIYEAEMLRRAAVACRNVRTQPASASREWFEWVDAHLDRLADRLTESPLPAGSGCVGEPGDAP